MPKFSEVMDHSEYIGTNSRDWPLFIYLFNMFYLHQASFVWKRLWIVLSSQSGVFKAKKMFKYLKISCISKTHRMPMWTTTLLSSHPRPQQTPSRWAAARVTRMNWYLQRREINDLPPALRGADMLCCVIRPNTTHCYRDCWGTVSHHMS